MGLGGLLVLLVLGFMLGWQVDVMSPAWLVLAGCLMCPHPRSSGSDHGHMCRASDSWGPSGFSISGELHMAHDSSL
jgi:hypothetical protein